MSDVTVIGLGQMGVRLVELLREAGNSVTVWNRTEGKATALEGGSVVVAATPAEALAASPVTLAVVADDEATREVLGAHGVGDALQGRTLVNLGTSGPDAAREFGELVEARGGRYLDGAIQAAPSQMGEPDTPILLSGTAEAFDHAEPLLRILAGNLVVVGQEVDAAAFMDLATLSYVYGSYAGFLHGVRIAETTGADPAVFGDLVKQISPSFGAFFAHQGGVIASDDFTVSESPMRISISAVERISRTSRELGIGSELPDVMGGWLGRAVERGLEDQEVAALIKVLRG